MECQDHFALSLTVPQDMMELSACNDAFCGNGRSLKIETMDDSQVQEAPYIPANEIKPEVLAMLAAWKSTKLERQQAQRPDSAMKIVPLESSDSFVIERNAPICCRTTEPPSDSIGHSGGRSLVGLSRKQRTITFNTEFLS